MEEQSGAPEFDLLVRTYVDEVRAMGRYQPDTPFYRSHAAAAQRILELIKYFMEYASGSDV